MKKQIISSLMAGAVLSMSMPVFAQEAADAETQPTNTATDTAAPADTTQAPNPEHTPNMGRSREAHERNRIRKREHQAEKAEQRRKRIEKKAQRKAGKGQHGGHGGMGH